MFLSLQDADRFPDHSFCRTSASILDNADADLIVLKRHGDSKSLSVAEEYREDSL